MSNNLKDYGKVYSNGQTANERKTIERNIQQDKNNQYKKPIR